MRCKQCELENNIGVCDRKDCSNYTEGTPMKEIEQAIHNHDCCMRPEKLFEAIEQYVIKARIESAKKVLECWKEDNSNTGAGSGVIYDLEAQLKKGLNEVSL